MTLLKSRVSLFNSAAATRMCKSRLIFDRSNKTFELWKLPVEFGLVIARVSIEVRLVVSAGDRVSGESRARTEGAL